MSSTGSNLLSMKKNNRSQILSNLQKLGKTSRKNLSDILQLTRASITILVNEMINEKIIVELGEDYERRQIGRRIQLIDVNYSYKYILGVNLEPGNSFVCLGSMDLKPISIKKLSQYNKNTEHLLKEIEKKAIEIIKENNLDKERILGLGVSIVGIVDVKSGKSINSWGLVEDNLDIKKMLSTSLELPVFVDNNVRALAQTEVFLNSPNPSENAIFVKYGNGIGSAIILNEEFYIGDKLKSGEIGHILSQPKGEKCHCGKKGCLETVASTWAIRKKLNIPKEISEEEILGRYKKGDEDLISLFDKAMTHLAIAIQNYIKLLDPQEVILYGYIFEEPALVQNLRDKIRTFSSDLTLDENIKISKHNLKLDKISPLSIVLREFINQGGDPLN